MSFNFELGTPFKPFEQLMGVLPVGVQKLLRGWSGVDTAMAGLQTEKEGAKKQ